MLLPLKQKRHHEKFPYVYEKMPAKTKDLLHHLNLKQKSPHFTTKCNQKCTSTSSLERKVQSKVQAFEKSRSKSARLRKKCNQKCEPLKK